MKKLLFIALLAMIMVGCESNRVRVKFVSVGQTVVVDSCEYLVGYGHKGNCKFCAERNRKMIKAQIDSALIETFD